MQQRDKTDVGTPAVLLPPRKVVHDLRNLFAIVGAAKSLLERDPAPSRRRELLDALGEATRQGAQLTTDLLANREDHTQWRDVDVDRRLAGLAPMLRVLATARIKFAEGGVDERLMVRTMPAELDATVLELASNAARAGASEVMIRGRRCGERIWLIISDNGCGMSEYTLERARRGRDLGLAHGSGLSRVQQFMATCDGQARIRSCVGHGTTIALIFPASNGQITCPAGEPSALASQQLIAA